MSTSSSVAKPEFSPGELISEYEIVRKLGSGGFGAVYLVKKDEMEYALKTEFVEENEEQTLKNEVHMLKLMQWSDAFCKLYTAKRVPWLSHHVNIMVMTLTDRPLSRLRRMMPDRHFTKSTAARLSFQLLEALRDLHSTGIIHRDVKASNCGWHPASRHLLLFDLGFSRKFLELDETKTKLRHRTARSSAGFMGTSKYCSMFAHEELDQGRRDDLWAWLYSTVEFFLGGLPWSTEEKTILVSTMKRKAGKGLFFKCPREIALIYEHVRHLKFNSCPDYNSMFSLFHQMFIRLDIDVEDPMDFEPGSAHFDEYYKDKKSDSELEEESTQDPQVDEISLMLTEEDKIASRKQQKVEIGKELEEGEHNLGRIAAGFNRAINRLING